MCYVGKTLVTHRAVGRGLVVEQHLAAVVLESGLGGLGGVGSDGQQPGLEAGAALKTCQAARHDEPGILHHLIGVGLPTMA